MHFFKHKSFTPALNTSFVMFIEEIISQTVSWNFFNVESCVVFML